MSVANAQKHSFILVLSHPGRLNGLSIHEMTWFLPINPVLLIISPWHWCSMQALSCKLFMYSIVQTNTHYRRYSELTIRYTHSIMNSRVENQWPSQNLWRHVGDESNDYQYHKHVQCENVKNVYFACLPHHVILFISYLGRWYLWVNIT